MHKFTGIGLASIGVILTLSGCSASSSPTKHASAAQATTSVSPSTQATASKSPSATKPSASSRAESAEDVCDNRPDASGDIYVRMITPGVSPQAQELGGEWRWDSATNKCLTSVQLMIATAPQSAGNCTQVGYVADNPGYDANADTAAPLKNVVAQTGPAC